MAIIEWRRVVTDGVEYAISNCVHSRANWPTHIYADVDVPLLLWRYTVSPWIC